MGFCLCSVVKFETLNLSYKLRVLNHSDWTCALLIDRWNSWNFFACNINETVIKETADALVSSGLADLGYIHVNIGICPFDLSLHIFSI